MTRSMPSPPLLLLLLMSVGMYRLLRARAGADGDGGDMGTMKRVVVALLVFTKAYTGEKKKKERKKCLEDRGLAVGILSAGGL